MRLSNRFGIRLFIVIFLINLLISIVIYFSVARSIDQGFLRYIQQGQAQQAELLSEIIAQRWQISQGWSWLYQPGIWSNLLRQTLANDNDEVTLNDANDMSSFMLPLAYRRNWVLVDNEGKLLKGQLHPQIRLQFLPIKVNNQLIGRLGYRPLNQAPGRLDQLFLRTQLHNLATILLASLPASLILSAGIAWWISRRGRHLALAAQTLTQGDYAIRLPVLGQDDLSRLSNDLNQLARALQHNRAARKRWSADIAHELRTPLAILRGELEAMQDGVREINTSSLASLSQEVELLQRLVNDLSLLAQSDSHSLAAPMEWLCLDDLLCNHLMERAFALEQAGLQLTMDFDQDVRFLGAPYRLRQLWRNLLNNSIAYTDAPGFLKVTLRKQAQHVLILWEDSAPGVPENALAHLTERLFRVESSRNRQQGGSGLGLAIVQALVELHNGTLTASHSALGGLCWTIRLPLSIQHAKAFTEHNQIKEIH